MRREIACSTARRMEKEGDLDLNFRLVISPLSEGPFNPAPRASSKCGARGGASTTSPGTNSKLSAGGCRDNRRSNQKSCTIGPWNELIAML